MTEIMTKNTNYDYIFYDIHGNVVFQCNSQKIDDGDYENERQDYAHKEGVFLAKNGKHIARVRKGVYKVFTTISQHDTQEEAQTAYDDFKTANK